MTDAAYKVGDKIAVDDPKYPGVWIVRKVNPTTYAADPEGGGRGLKLPHYMALPPEQAASDPFEAAQDARPDSLRTGALVRVAPGRCRGLADRAPCVVIADKFDQVNITELGGRADRRYWKVPPSWITEVIDPARVTVAES